MKVFYDTEFYEDGETIDLISIGMVREDGYELYFINKEFDLNRVPPNHWIVDNVYPHLPVVQDDEDGVWYWNTDHEDSGSVIDKKDIAHQIEHFLYLTYVELYAYFAAYDHVVLAQLYGRMINMPPRIPQFTNDLMTLITMYGVEEDSLPEHTNHHKAIDDARWNQDVYSYIVSLRDDTWEDML